MKRIHEMNERLKRLNEWPAAAGQYVICMYICVDLQVGADRGLKRTNHDSNNKQELVDAEPGVVMPSGLERHSQAWGQWLSQQRWNKRAPDVNQELQRNFEGLGKVWNVVPVRYGNRVASKDDLADNRTHSNTYTPEACIKIACKEVSGAGCTQLGQQSVDDTRHRMDMLLNCGAVSKTLFRQGASDLYEQSRDAPGIVIQRGFDTTPMLCRCGTMGPKMYEHAKYLKKLEPTPDKPYQKWTLVSYEEYRKENPRSPTPGIGVLEIFLMNGEIVTPSFDDVEKWRDTYEAVVQPMILSLSVLQHNNASCMHSSLEEAFWPFDLAGLESLSELLLRDEGAGIHNGSLIILDDVADMSKANGLLRKKVMSVLRDLINVLYFPSSYCCAHILHRLITAMFGEDAVVGHVHACQHVLGIMGRREMLLKSLLAIIDRDLIVKHGEPPAELKEHFEAVLAQTLLRRIALIRARQENGACDDDDIDGVSVASLVSSLPAL